MAKIELKNISKTYPNGRCAVNNFCMEVSDGEIVCLAGGAGSGKTAVLKMLAGLDEPTSGEIYIDGKSVNGSSPRDRGAAMILQSYALYPNMTVAENLGFGLMLEGCGADEVESRVAKTAEILGLTDCLDKFPRGLDAGRCRRVCLGRALIRGLKIMLVDEPSSGRGFGQGAELVAEIKRVNHAVGATVIFTARDERSAEIADRVICMRECGAKSEVAR